jgi:hypothetical protein
MKMFLLMKKNRRFLDDYLPLICNKARPVAICWQIKITGLKLHS